MTKSMLKLTKIHKIYIKKSYFIARNGFNAYSLRISASC